MADNAMRAKAAYDEAESKPMSASPVFKLIQEIRENLMQCDDIIAEGLRPQLKVVLNQHDTVGAGSPTLAREPQPTGLLQELLDLVEFSQRTRERLVSLNSEIIL